MLHQVRIFDSKGKIKKILCRREVENLFWKRFWEKEESKNSRPAGEKKLSYQMKKMLKSQFPELYDLSYLYNH